MAKLAWLPSAIVFMLVLAFVIQLSYAGGEGSLRLEECSKACDYRCSATQHTKPCLLFCNKCCAKCLCVPSGTYGHKEECPCYNNWKTKKGGPKCP
ncbi:Gibberellin-regulated family protein [Quillaja saponaria]|uniref:Gibberellin-regulated family protein n=1 Tax=Quillaja saponaria TaxID=32244 RepID=A0AAD7LP19_QUISA|nr:Gibberellin-regulated family protein [Quillaja saponaria]